MACLVVITALLSLTPPVIPASVSAPPPGHTSVLPDCHCEEPQGDVAIPCLETHRPALTRTPLGARLPRRLSAPRNDSKRARTSERKRRRQSYDQPPPPPNANKCNHRILMLLPHAGDSLCGLDLPHPSPPTGWPST